MSDTKDDINRMAWMPESFRQAFVSRYDDMLMGIKSEQDAREKQQETINARENAPDDFTLNRCHKCHRRPSIVEIEGDMCHGGRDPSSFAVSCACGMTGKAFHHFIDSDSKRECRRMAAEFWGIEKKDDKSWTKKKLLN